MNTSLIAAAALGSYFLTTTEPGVGACVGKPGIHYQCAEPEQIFLVGRSRIRLLLRRLRLDLLGKQKRKELITVLIMNSVQFIQRNMIQSRFKNKNLFRVQNDKFLCLEPQPPFYARSTIRTTTVCVQFSDGTFSDWDVQ